MSNKGFTLAEVLITLGIIGVVAAMTIPTIVAKMNGTYNEQKVQIQRDIINNSSFDRSSRFDNTNGQNVDLNQYRDCSVLIINGNQIICKK